MKFIKTTISLIRKVDNLKEIFALASAIKDVFLYASERFKTLEVDLEKGVFDTKK